MPIVINSFSPNTTIQSSQVNANFNALADGVTDTSYRAYTWGVLGTLAVLDEQGMKYIVPSDVTAIKIWAKTDVGTATIRIQKDTTDVVTGLAVTSTVSSSVVFNTDEVAAGQMLTLDITAVTGATNLFVTLETQVTSVN